MSKFQVPLFLIAIAALGSHTFSGPDHKAHDVNLSDHTQHVVNPKVDAHDHEADAAHNQAGHAWHADSPALASHLETGDDLDHIALAEMHAAALRYPGEVHELPGAFGTADTWSHEWTLRWNDYTTGTNTIRVYHATNRHNPDLRYTWLYSAHGHDADWHPTH